ncbi:hypothetical protein JMJ35_002053 [Cladonia borealis]|uniref:Uncharacterized protein n=1 Tax=Cladonia borealis TaxID=184061 RepID=A0AA39R976_9LECA|nr:hypothetical protein JMJ35_002053 [Cladonia borealis]
MHVSFQALVLAALSLECALAQPAHRHQHQHKHRRDLADILNAKRDVDYNNPDLYTGVDWAKVCANGGCAPGSDNAQSSAAAAPPASTPSSTPAASPQEKDAVVGGTPSSSAPATSSTPAKSSGSGPSTGSCNDLSSVWSSGDTSRSSMVYMGDGSSCPGGCTSADGKPYTSFGGTTPPSNVGHTDAYEGNVGSPYGHNILPVSDCSTDGHDYTITFTANSDIEVALWNKVGDDYQTAGRVQTGASRNAFFKFALSSGQSAVFAFAPNSQVAFSQACDRSGTTGQFDCTWGEADFADANTPNDGASGYDRSSIPNSAGNTGLLTVCAAGFSCSSQQANSFVSTSQLNTGGNTNIPAGQPAHLKVTMG